MMQPLTFVRGAERMVTATRLVPEGLYVRFADDRDGVVPLDALDLPQPPAQVSLPRPHVVEIHLGDGSTEEVPWDFARHFVDGGHRVRSEATADEGRRRFGRRLRVLRAERGFTQRQLAERSGVSRVSIARMETGDQHPRYPTLVGIARGLGIPVRRLVADEGE